MNIQLHHFLMLSYILVCFGCNKAQCPDRKDLGVLEFTSETKSYLPDRYFSKTDTLEFKSTEGKISKFYLDRITYSALGPLSTDIPCEDDNTQTIRVSYEYPDNYHVYYSTDSLKLILINKVGTTQNGYYDLLNIWLSKEGGILNVYGQINIITDNRTITNGSIIENPVSFTYYENIDIGGQSFSGVYGKKSPSGSGANVYWKQNIGMIGYTDKAGVDWVLKN